MNTEKKQITTVITGCIIDGRRILLTRRFEPELPKADKKWDLPGGKVEFGESTEEVVRREVKEETGLEIEPLELIPYVHTNLWRYLDRTLHVIVMCYICRLIDKPGKIQIKLDEVSRAKWIDIGEIDLTKTLPGIREFLAWIAKEKFNINDVEPIEHKFVYLKCIKPSENAHKFFFLSDAPPTVLTEAKQLMLFTKNEQGTSIRARAGFVLTRSWGRIGSAGRLAIEEYYSSRIVVRRFRQILKERKKHGYEIIESNIGRSFEEIFHYLDQETDQYLKDA